MNMPQGKWIKRSELNCVGLSSAVKALLQKAGLFCLILFGSSCATHTTIARNLPIDQKALPGPDEEVADDEQVNIDDEALRGALIVAALDAVGSRQIRVDGSIFRRDCSGTVRGIFAKAGLTLRDAKALRGYSDSQSLMDYIEEIGEIKHESPRPGDLVFFKETYNVKRNHENISHVGVVTRVSDEDVHYVHFSSGRIIESSMGDQLRRRRRGVKAKTGTELFAGYGELDLNAVKYVL